MPSCDGWGDRAEPHQRKDSDAGVVRAGRRDAAVSRDARYAASPLLYVRAGVAVPVSEDGQTMPWHSLRHTFGTECAKRGVPIPTLRDLMGHTDVKTTLRYVTVTSDDRRNAIQRAFGLMGLGPFGQQVGNENGPKKENAPISGR